MSGIEAGKGSAEIRYRRMRIVYQHDPVLRRTDQPLLTGDSRDMVRHLLYNDDLNCGSIVFAPADDKEGFAAQDLPVFVTLEGSISGIIVRESVYSSGQYQGRRYDFQCRLNGESWRIVVLRIKLMTGTLTVSFWSPDSAAKKLDSWISQFSLVESAGVKASKAALPVRILCIVVISSILLEALLSIFTNTPIWGFLGLDSANIVFSFVIMALMISWMVGILLKKSWGVVGFTVIAIVIALTGLLVLLLASSLPGEYYVPAVKQGGILAFLWYLNLVLCILSPVATIIFRESLIED